MKKDLKQTLTIQKALDALDQQVLRDEEAQEVKGGLKIKIIFLGMEFEV